MTHEIRWHWQPTGKGQPIEQWQRVVEPKWVPVGADIMPKQKVNNGWIDAWAKSLSSRLRESLPSNCRIDVVSSRTLGDVFGYLRIRVALPGRWYRIAELRPINQANPSAVIETNVPVVAPVITKPTVQECANNRTLYLVSLYLHCAPYKAEEHQAFSSSLGIRWEHYIVWAEDKEHAIKLAQQQFLSHEPRWFYRNTDFKFAYARAVIGTP